MMLLWWLPGWTQDNPTQRLFLDTPADTFYFQVDTLSDSLKLPDQFINPGTDKIFRQDFKLLRGIHYRLNENEGLLVFLRPLPAGDSLQIIYQKYPFPLTRGYFHRELQKITPAGVSTADRSLFEEDGF